MPSPPAPHPLLLPLLSITLGVAASLITNSLLKTSRSKQQLAAYKVDHAAKAKQQEKQKKDDEKSGTLIDDVSIDKIYLWEVEHLSSRFPAAAPVVNKMKNRSSVNNEYSEYTHSEAEYNKLITSHECILADIKLSPTSDKSVRAYVRAGPRKHLHFDPSLVTAAIVTCGGLCPGLNNVVRELTNSLHQLYGVKKVLGVRGGYAGFYTEGKEWEPVVLTPKTVETLHHAGGSFLGSSRGGFDLEKIIVFLKKHNVSQLFVIGGDGTHRGAFKVHEGCMEHGMNVAVCGIPKTIDNDIDHIDRSFGFSSAVEAAQSAIRTAKVRQASK